MFIDTNPFFEWAPGISIEKVEIEEESSEDIVVENVDEDREIAQEIGENVEEGAYITATESISEKEDSPPDDNFTALLNDFDDVNDKMDCIIKDLNESRYYSEEEDLSIDSDDEVLIEDEPVWKVYQSSEGARMSERINSGTGVDRLEHTHGGKTHNEVKNNIQFLMSEER